jgi:hypothetical protein
VTRAKESLGRKFRIGPGCAKGVNLCGLLDVERLTGLVEFEG